MVLKTELCRFSGVKIYPGKGIRFVWVDSKVFLFANSKCKRYFHNRLRPAKLTQTTMYNNNTKSSATSPYKKSTELGIHELILDEINTLDWEALVGQHSYIDSSAHREGATTFFNQQMDGTNQNVHTKIEHREDLPLMNILLHHGSPLTPLNSTSASSHSEMSGSVVLS